MRWQTLVLLSPSGIERHLAVSFVRSHGNAAVFDRHPYRFTVVPLAVLALIAGSGWFRALAGVVAVLWDVHHSGMQTFGLARLYESRNGNDPRVGRRLDLWLNQLLYVGPILAGAGFLLHYRALGPDLSRVGDAFFTPPLALASGPPRWLSLAIVGFGLPSLAGYAIASIRLRRRGQRSVGPKFLLLVATGFCSVVSWGFNSFGEALFTMKLFHVVQYFTLIAWSERRTVAEGLGVEASRFSLARAATVLVVSASVFGLWAELQQARATPSELALSLILTVNLMHFWYDGFMWSVRKGEI